MNWRRLAQLPWKKIAIYVLSLAIPFFLENAADIFELNPSAPQNSLLSPIFLYQWAVTAGPRKPRPHFVRLVMIDPKTEPPDVASETSPCKQRDFVAQLLRTVAAANPAVIVVDKFYPGDVCSDSETTDLKNTVSKIAANLPIVFCKFDKSEYDLQNRDPTKLGILKKRNAVVMFPTVDFGGDAHYGLKALNSDTRKIPLQWPAYDSKDFDDLPSRDFFDLQPAETETLAVTAVKPYDPTTLAQDVIRRFNKNKQHPFTSFLKASQIPTDSPIDLICDRDQAKNLDWRNACKTPNLVSERLRNLRNRVVVIGQNHSADMHQSVIGTVPGVILQANYIESLLDDRYLKPTPLLIQILISFAWLGVIEWIFTRCEAKPWSALGYSAAATALLWFLTYDIAILQLGYYLVLWPPSVLAMLSRFAMLKLKAPPAPGVH